MLWELCARGAQRINPTAFEHESAERKAGMLFCTGCSTSPSGGGLPDYKQSYRKTEATARGFEPLRAEPNGFRVHLLNRSDTMSLRIIASNQENKKTNLSIALPGRLELPTLRLTASRSNQLSYGSMAIRFFCNAICKF